MKNFSLILAVDDKNWLWKDGDLAWRIPEDMKYFKQITTTTYCENSENAVVMGRKTWDSIPEKFRPLPGRMNCILSSSGTKKWEKIADHTYKFDSLHACMKFVSKRKEIEHIFIIWGSQLYNSVLDHPKLQRIYLTQVSWDYECDVFFDGIPENFKLVSKSQDKIHKWAEYTFLVYKKKGIMSKLKIA